MQMFDVELPQQRFFKPAGNFWEVLQDNTKGVRIMECGCGSGDTVVEGQALGIDIVGCDITRRTGVPRERVDHIPAHMVPFSKDLAALVCRPDHGGWVADLADLCKEKGANLIYVGLLKNIISDLEDHVPYMNTLSNKVGEEGEIMVILPYGESSE